ncbi:hypothetical protein [Fulvivirga lutimaris]|uniref:hypothetical protein n=1 Tax=Fulvivirga lutimaris TaxID=1819566 RepID=UPI0012BB82EB|nr:hypothetical protein [Fulvivirga lutimaris]MTI40738.1 hypothetical protein [Fulvivirga lutimaris]
MTADEKLDIINAFLTPIIREKFSEEEIKEICKQLYLCESKDQISDKIDGYVIEFAHRGEKIDYKKGEL